MAHLYQYLDEEGREGIAAVETVDEFFIGYHIRLAFEPSTLNRARAKHQ